MGEAGGIGLFVCDSFGWIGSGTELWHYEEVSLIFFSLCVGSRTSGAGGQGRQSTDKARTRHSQLDRNKGSDASTSPSSSSPGTFPAGSFAFTAALIERATGCAENADTWRCYPYQTYSDSAVDSGATFFWILSPTTSSSEEEGQDDAAAGYQISSSENPFSPRFDNVSMKVLDRHQYTERFSFEFSMNKTGSSASPLPVNLDAGGAAGDSDSTETPGEVDGGAQSANTASKRQEEEAETKPATCTFGDTVFQATIWTRQPPNVTTGLGGSTPDFDRKFGSWPGRVQIMQRTGGGPSCKDLAGGAIEARKGEGECLCRYANFGME